MKTVVTWLAWTTMALVVALGVLNWQTMMATAPINFVVTAVQWPLGLVMLGLAAIPLALFWLAWLHQQISALLEARRLLKEVQRAHALADTAEASRIEGLRQWLGNEFRVLNARLDSLGAALPADSAPPERPSPVLRILPASWRGEARIP